MNNKLEKGYFVISLDVEFAWGRIDNPQQKEFYPLLEKTSEVIKRLRVLFDLYNIPVTWACVGRLIEDPNNATPAYSSELSRYFPKINSQTIYSSKTPLNDVDNSFINRPDILIEIQQAKVAHEIATHTYNHMFFNEVLDKSLIEEDLKAVTNLHSKIKHPAKSIIFPKNQENHFDLIKAAGIENYRGETVERFGYLPPFFKKIARQLDAFLPVSPATVLPYTGPNGLVNIPGTKLFATSHLGFKKHYPVNMLAIKSINGLKRAIRRKEVFHIWWHPFNFGFKTEEHFHALEKVLEFAIEQQKKGYLEVLTMNDIGNRYRAKIL